MATARRAGIQLAAAATAISSIGTTTKRRQVPRAAAHEVQIHDGRDGERAAGTERDADQRLADDLRHDLPRLRPERDADADLRRALRHAVVDDGVDADRQRARSSSGPSTANIRAGTRRSTRFLAMCSGSVRTLNTGSVGSRSLEHAPDAGRERRLAARRASARGSRRPPAGDRAGSRE